MTKLVRFTRAMAPHRVGDEKLFVDAVADAAVAQGIAIYIDSPHGKAPLPVAKPDEDEPPKKVTGPTEYSTRVMTPVHRGGHRR